MAKISANGVFWSGAATAGGNEEEDEDEDEDDEEDEDGMLPAGVAIIGLVRGCSAILQSSLVFNFAIFGWL
jgi:hypothetical protein